MRIEKVGQLIEILQQIIPKHHGMGGVINQLDPGCLHHDPGGALDGDLPLPNLEGNQITAVSVAQYDGLTVVVEGDPVRVPGTSRPT